MDMSFGAITQPPTTLFHGTVIIISDVIGILTLKGSSGLE